MPKTYFRGSYSKSADGMYHTSPIEGKPKAPKHKPRELSERAVRLAEMRESDADVCRRCTKNKCRGTADCVRRERVRQEKERLKENGSIEYEG